MKYLIIHCAFTDPPELGYFGDAPQPPMNDHTYRDTEERMLERIFTRHNVDDRPDRFMRPSLSSNVVGKGDLVVLFGFKCDGTYSVWECKPTGWNLAPTTHWPRTNVWNGIYVTVEEINKYGA